MTKSKRGGPGLGQGRKKMPKSEKALRKSFRFYAEDWALLQALAQKWYKGRRGGLTDTVRRAIREAAEREGLL